jgi:Skp family chaperone for outer membrane proteins
MSCKTLVASICVATLSFAAASSATAQTAAAPAAALGPAIANVCVLSVEGAIATSTVGKYANTQMDSIAKAVSAELSGERNAVETEAKTLDSQKGSLDQATLQSRATALQTKANNLNRKAALREREVGATQQKALTRIGQEMDPVIRQIAQQKQCGLVLSREAVIVANSSMDITPAVVAGLNAKITQFAIARERLDQQPASASK